MLQPLPLAILVACMFAMAGCGYHTSGHMVRLPSDIHTIYVPMFQNTTQTFRVEQTLTAAVVKNCAAGRSFVSLL